MSIPIHSPIAGLSYGPGILAASLVSLVLGVLLTGLSKGLILRMIASSGYCRANYKGQDIPVTAGLIPFLSGLMATLVPAALGWVPNRVSLAFTVFLAGFSYLGLIDDLMGNREKSGLKGHILALIKEGQLTTGALKALYGSGLSLAVSWLLGGNFGEVFLRALVLALSANLINLLDLRPGRALKGYGLVVIISLISIPALGKIPISPWILQAALLGAVLPYAPTDLRAGAMMGDTGSNLLGASAGLAISFAGLQLGNVWLVIWLVLLVAIHIFAEKRSITKAIEGNPVLKALDELGRGGA